MQFKFKKTYQEEKEFNLSKDKYENILLWEFTLKITDDLLKCFILIKNKSNELLNMENNNTNNALSKKCKYFKINNEKNLSNLKNNLNPEKEKGKLFILFYFS